MRFSFCPRADLYEQFEKFMSTDVDITKQNLIILGHVIFYVFFYVSVCHSFYRVCNCVGYGAAFVEVAAKPGQRNESC